MKALLVCQDPDEMAILSLALQRASLDVTRTRTMQASLPQPEDNPINLIVLCVDAGIPLRQVKEIRAQTDIPLIVIAENLEEGTQVMAFDHGADLVILRPFSTRLLIAQTRALMRRGASLPLYTLPTLSYQGVELDPAAHTVVVGKRAPKRLTQLEFRLLYALMIHKEQVLPTEVLVEQVWGYSGEGARDLVRGLVRRLRSKIEPDPRTPQYVITVPGVGYTFSPES